MEKENGWPLHNSNPNVNKAGGPYEYQLYRFDFLARWQALWHSLPTDNSAATVACCSKAAPITFVIEVEVEHFLFG